MESEFYHILWVRIAPISSQKFLFPQTDSPKGLLGPSYPKKLYLIKSLLDHLLKDISSGKRVDSKVSYTMRQMSDKGFSRATPEEGLLRPKAGSCGWQPMWQVCFSQAGCDAPCKINKMKHDRWGLLVTLDQGCQLTEWWDKLTELNGT